MITRDESGAVVLIETPTASLRLYRGVWYAILADGQGGEVRARIDPELGLSAWHRPPERPVEPIEPAKPLPDNVLEWIKK